MRPRLRCRVGATGRLRRFVEMAQADPALRERQPWKAASENDHAWFATVMTEHYAGDDHNVKTLAGGVLAAYAGVSVEDFETRADTFLRGTQHPTLGRAYLECAYAPMVELLDLLAANGFANYIVSGGGRDFMRPITQDAEREFEYTAGAQQTLEQAGPAGWTTVSVRDDWATVF